MSEIKISTDKGEQTCEPIYTRGSYAVIAYGAAETPYSVTHIPTGARLVACATRKAAEWACRQSAMYLRPELDSVPFGTDPRTVLDRTTLHALARETKRIRAEAQRRDEEPSAIAAERAR